MTREESLEIIRRASGRNAHAASKPSHTVHDNTQQQSSGAGSREDALRIIHSAMGGGNTQTQDAAASSSASYAGSSPKRGAYAASPRSAAPTARLTQGSLALEGRSAEQIQREISDSRKRLEQLQLEAAYILTIEPGAELDRQMGEERARIKALNKELDALKAPRTNAERDSLIQRMNAITENEGYATTVELADAVTQEKQDTRRRLHQLDEELGNAARFYDSGERAGAVVKGALKQTGSAYTNFMGTLQGLGNRLHESSSAADQAVAGSDYAGWATDELTAANMAEAIMKENPDENYLEGLQKEEQRLYEKADTVAASAAKDIAQAKEGLSALGQAGVDISVAIIQNGIDAVAKKSGLGMLPFFVRAAGGSMQEARHSGASTGQQLAYGLPKAAIEVATELLSGGIAGTGVSGIDDVIEPLINKLAKSTAGKVALSAVYDAAMEGTEEVLSDLLDPFVKLVYNDQALKEAWENRADVGAQMLYDYLIGAVVGSIGSGTKILTGAATDEVVTGKPVKTGAVTGQYAEKNAALAGSETQEQTGAETKAAEQAENLTAQTQEKSYPTVEELIQPIRPAGNADAEAVAPSSAGGNAPVNAGVQARAQVQTAGQQVMTREEQARKEADWWANREKEAEKAYEDAKKRYEESLNRGNADEFDFLSSPEIRKTLMDMAEKDLEDVRNRKIPSPFSNAEAQAVGTAADEETPQPATPTAPLAEEPLLGAQTHAAEAPQNAQRATPQAETPPTTQNAAQAVSDALNRHETHNVDVVNAYDATNKQALRAALEFIRIAEDSGVSPDDAYQFLSLEQQMALDKYNASREAPNSRFSFDEFYRSYDWKAARERASAAYDNFVKRWYSEHPGANEIDPNSILADRDRFINQYIRDRYKNDANNASKAFNKNAATQKTFQMALDKYNTSREAPNSRFSFDEFYRSYDWKAARERASAAYDNAVKRWYSKHPDANEIDPNSILADRDRFINQYIRDRYKNDVNNAFEAFKQTAAMQKNFEEDHRNDNSYNPDHSSLNDIRRVDDAYEDELDKYGEPKRYESRYDNDIAGNFVGTEAKVAGRKRSWLSDEDAPPESRNERYYDDQLRMESRRKFREDEERRKKYKIDPPTAWGKQQMGVYTKPSSESDSTQFNLSAEEKQNLADAIKMKNLGATPSEIYNATGLVIKANGDVEDSSGRTLWKASEASENETQASSVEERGRVSESEQPVYDERSEGQIPAEMGEESTRTEIGDNQSDEHNNVSQNPADMDQSADLSRDTSSLHDSIDGASKSDAQPEANAVTDERGNYATFSYGEDDGLGPVVPNSGHPNTVSDEALKAKFYSGLSENRDENGVRKSYHSSAITYAEHTFGNQLESIQESTKRVTDTDTSKLYKDTQEQVLRLKSMMDDVAHGCAEMRDLLDVYRSMGESSAMADFYNESAMNMLERACNELRDADSSSTPYAVNRFRWDAEKAFAMMSKSFERGNQAIADKAAFSKAALENLKPAKLGRNGKERLDVPGWYKIFQTNAPNMFRSIDGWKNKGGIGYQLADQAEQCFVNQTKEQAAGEDFFAGIEKTDGFDKFLKGGKSVSISVGEKTYSMNEQEAVSLLKAVKTIYASGGKTRSEALSGLRIGEKTVVFPDNFKMFSLFSQIDSQLSKAGRAYMNAFDGMLSYYSGRLKETSSEVYGFGKGMYSRGDYMPLRYSTADGKISSTSIQQDAANGYDTMRIMQERGATHGGYLLVEPVTIVAERYMRNASDYIAYSAFAERMAGLNRSTENGDGASDILRKYYGKNGSQWMDRYASRVSQLYAHKETSTFDDFLKRLRMNLYQGALGMSVTVPMKQYASYWSAADVLGIGTLLEARAKYFGNKGDSLENSVMRSRRRGSIDPTYSDILHSDETMIGRMKKNSKVVRWLADGISRTDAKVFDSMYFACELAVKKENPKIDLNSKEYREKVDDKFNQIAMRTQSIFAPTISADMQMTDNEFLKTISVFRTQQTQDFNRVLKAVGEYQNAEGSAKKEAGKVLANSISGSVVGSISLGVMTAIARLMLHKKRDYEDEEGNFDAGLLMRNIAFDSIKSLAGIAWFGDELASYALSVITRGDEKYYGLPMGGIDSISDVMDSISNFSENPSVYNAKQTVTKLTTLLGIPANNVYSMLNSVVMYSIDAVGGNDGRYDDIIKWLHNESGGNIRDFSAEGVEFDLSFGERKSYKTVQDKARNKLTTDYATQPGVALLDDDQQENVMEAIESYATAKAKQTILDARNSDAELNRDSWHELPENQIAGFLVAREQAKALYDDDGNINSYADMDRYLRSYYSKLTANQKEMLSKSSSLARLDDLYNAQRAGIDSKTYDVAYQLYRKYDSAKGNGTARAEDLKTEISKLGLTSIQTAWLEKNLQLYRVTPIDTDAYDKLVSAGISNDSANRLQDDMRSLPVLEGHSGIIDNQKYRAIMEANYLSEDDKWKAFEAIATEAALREANANRAIGLSYEQWLTTSRKYGKIE